MLCEIFSIQELLTTDANFKTSEYSEEDTRYMRVLLGILENVLMIAVKKSLIFAGNVRATTWWIFSFSFSFIMFVQSVGSNVGGLLAIRPNENDVTMRNSIYTKFALFICCLALYFVLLFAFKPPEVPYIGEENKPAIEILEDKTGIWLAEYSKANIVQMQEATGAFFAVFGTALCFVF